MAENQKNEWQPNEQDQVMVYINPEVMQTLADMSAKKQADFQELFDAAQEGEPEAEYRLALSYYRGEHGAPQDDEKAFQWFTKAAAGDHIAAQYYVGSCYARGTRSEERRVGKECL